MPMFNKPTKLTLLSQDCYQGGCGAVDSQCACISLYIDIDLSSELAMLDVRNGLLSE